MFQLWDMAEAHSLSDEDIQKALDRLSAWIKLVDTNKPKKIGQESVS